MKAKSFHAHIVDPHMTGLLHEDKFNVRDLLEPAIFERLPWAYVMCKCAQILIGDRHWPSQETVHRNWPFKVLGRIYGHSYLGHKFCQKKQLFTVCQQGSIKSLQGDDRLSQWSQLCHRKVT